LFINFTAQYNNGIMLIIAGEKKDN
jgi:hypothetical protein